MRKKYCSLIKTGLPFSQLLAFLVASLLRGTEPWQCYCLWEEQHGFYGHWLNIIVV